MPDVPLDFGTSGVIIPSRDGYSVRKKRRRGARGLSEEEQRALHQTISEILIDDNNYDRLRVPLLNEPCPEFPEEQYWMEKIRTDRPIFLGDPDSRTACSLNLLEDLERELPRFWRTLWNHPRGGWAAWDFELYLQPNGRVHMIDFDKFCRRSALNAAEAPYYSETPLAPVIFFETACFQPRFRDAVGGEILNWDTMFQYSRP